MTKKRKISKKEAEEIRLAIAEIAIDHSLKDICYIGALQLFGSHLFLKLIHSRCKCLERITTLTVAISFPFLAIVAISPMLFKRF